VRARVLLGRAFRAGAFFDPRFFAPRDLLAAVRFFAVRFTAGERLFAVVARAGRLVVFFALFARAGRFLAVLLRGAAFARVVRFFAAVLRGPVFLAVARRGLVPVERFVPPALARVARFFAGALRARDFRAVLFRAGGLRRRGRVMTAGASSSSYTGGGVPAYSGCSSSAPKARLPPRQAAMMTAPNPYVETKNPMTNPSPGTSAPKRRIPNPAKNAPSRPLVPVPWTMRRPKISAVAT